MKKVKLLSLLMGVTLLLSSCASSSSSSDSTVLKVGASPAPHAEILDFAADLLLEQGITLEIVEFDDYVLPNTALDDGDLDANYFQHQPYLTVFNESNGTDIVSAAAIHYEPLGVYPGKCSDLEEIYEGAQIIVPNDGSNEGRALYLLEDLGLLVVDHTNGYDLTVMDIIDNPLNLDIVEMDADKIPSAVQDADFAIINGNYAIGAGLNETVLVTEDAEGESAQTYANIIAVREGDEDREDIQALIDVLLGEEVAEFIEEQYQGSVVSLG